MAKRTVTYERPGRAARRSLMSVTPFDWNMWRPVAPGETFPVFLAAAVLAFFATLVCLRRGYVLLYGDAVAHLAIARRIVDARSPGISQIGGVWLPLPHLLMLPFVQKMEWWQSGLGGAPISVVSYAASVAGMWRLGRRMMPARWALVATCFYALNANLLYLSTTAMTEALFLALLVWAVVATVEGVAAMRAEDVRRARRWMLAAGALIVAMAFTRYDGWVVGAAVWGCFAWEIRCAVDAVRLRLRARLVLLTMLCAAGPLLWFWYNHHFMGDWLDFMRGPYSAQAIERKTAPVGQHYRGWHNVGWAALIYARTAQIDAAAWECGWGVMTAAVGGLWRAQRESKSEAPPARRGGQPERLAWLLWVPFPFYIYSVAYAAVPIFIPQLWPHSFYNSRYGMEMLPALSLYATLAVSTAATWMRPRPEPWAKVVTHFAQPVAMLLCVANSVGMMYGVPLLLKEGMVNSTTRVALERGLADNLETMPANARVLMYTSAHVGALQMAGRTLRSVVSEQDWDSWHKALEAPAANAEYVIAIAGDPVDEAVKAHPEALTELVVLCTTGQPCARIYESPSGEKLNQR